MARPKDVAEDTQRYRDRASYIFDDDKVRGWVFAVPELSGMTHLLVQMRNDPRMRRHVFRNVNSMCTTVKHVPDRSNAHRLLDIQDMYMTYTGARVLGAPRPRVESDLKGFQRRLVRKCHARIEAWAEIKAAGGEGPK